MEKSNIQFKSLKLYMNFILVNCRDKLQWKGAFFHCYFLRASLCGSSLEHRHGGLTFYLIKFLLQAIFWGGKAKQKPLYGSHILELTPFTL